MAAEPHSCTNCSAEVAARRPSNSGKHWCSRPQCQAAKQRYYRKRSAKTAKQTEMQVVIEFVQALAHQERTPCAYCGLEDGIAGWYHRDASGMAPCAGLGNKGREIPELLDAVHPERVPGRS